MNTFHISAELRYKKQNYDDGQEATVVKRKTVSWAGAEYHHISFSYSGYRCICSIPQKLGIYIFMMLTPDSNLKVEYNLLKGKTSILWTYSLRLL